VSHDDETAAAPRRNPRLAFRAVGEEGGLVVDSEQSKVLVLNPTGSRIFGLLDGSHTRKQIVRALVDEFEISEEQARDDLDDFLQELERKAALEGQAAGR